MDNAFKKAWKETMAKETTTTYTVTVTHKGPHKDFDEIFKDKRCVKDWEAVEEKTETKNLPPKSKYSPETKIVRAFFKKAAEKAGLKYGGHGSAPYKGEGTYHIDYAYDAWRVPALTINFKMVRWDVKFPKGAGSLGKIDIWDSGVPSAPAWQGRTRHNHEIEFSIADPQAEEKLVELFKEWGCKYNT